MGQADEPLVEVVTDKVNAEIPSPFEASSSRFSPPKARTVRVGAVIGQIEVAGTAGAAQAKEPAARQGSRRTTSGGPGLPCASSKGAPVAAAPAAPDAPSGDAAATGAPVPRSAKACRRHSIDATALRGTGMAAA